ncbi:MAG TPA: glutamate-1-semialdehyde 2,1-aminomutase [Bryobacteraceae bacterium]|jgi:glutamate-1-semialdehyde 2,1-aminomutase|nr:glutamate-1-semialdehyde 2,1-aminomutase [Bryobacteraceae bacterium]
MNRCRSEALFARAQKLIPGGVNSPVRAFRSVGGTPPFIARGEGSKIYDVDGNEYIDYVLSWGPLILGHRPQIVTDALQEVLEIGTSFGAPTEREVELAELIRECVPSIEMVRLVSSGTEATMSAIRVARGFTGRDLTIKFEGCYHGHVDSLLVKAGSGMATLGIADTAGVPEAFAATTLALPFNSIEAVEKAFRERGDKIAAVIVEPVAGNMGCVPPLPGYLEALRSLTTKHDALLIFDEVMTGFRLGLGGAQQRFGIKPDLTTLGKIIGAGLPMAAYGGRADVMSKVAPTGPIYQAGTLSGNPLAVSAGIAMLRYLKSHPEVYDVIERRAAQLTAQAPSGITINRVGSMFTFFFSSEPVTGWESAKRSDTGQFKQFFHWMLDRGIYLAPSQFEAGFVSAAHSEEDVARTVAAAGQFFDQLK